MQNGLGACPVRPPEPRRQGRVKQHPATNLRLRLRDYQTDVTRFLTECRWVPRLGRLPVFCILRLVWETNKLNDINPFDTLRLAFEGRQLR
jgi:transposase